ncbi:MAG: zinc-binding dehydrogenase [Planctomycetota bacterium]|nr:zinc-binding dehydrogenase [Planctomycetota bacterium]
MRAAFIRQFGGPEVVQIGQLDRPNPGRGEVLVKVKASALNHLDVWVRKGRPGAEAKGAHILGSDAAGVVEKVGEDVEAFAVGDEVVVNAGVSCMKCAWCRRGDHSECPQFKLLGFQLPGTHAEYLVAPASNLGHKPLHLTWPEAAALPLSHLTAWHMLFPRARFRVGETVLIHGIGGGVALAALQIVKMTGGKAIVTSSSDEKLARAKELGAAHGLNYKTGGDVAAQVKELTGGRGADIAFDTVGAPTFPISFAAVRRGGRIVTCGVTGGREATVNLQLLYWNHISLIGSTMGSHEDFQCLLPAVGMSHLRPVVDKVYKLEQYAEAVRRMESGAQFGKIVLDIDA